MSKDKCDDLVEYGMMINADGIRQSVPWRLRNHRNLPALTNTQIEDISERFGLDTTGVTKLADYLGYCLDPNALPNVISVSRTMAISRGQKAISSTLKDIDRATDHLIRGFERLKSLYTDSIEHPEAAARFDQLHHDYDKMLHDIKALDRELRLLSKIPDLALDTRPTDRRIVADRRRQAVLISIFFFWKAAGRTLTISTNPVTSERGGPLVDFVNAIVTCVTDPPTPLSGETIVSDLRDLKNRGRSLGD